jgi:hypothetical protein
MANRLGNAAVISIVDPDGCVLATAEGQFVKWGSGDPPHAEEICIQRFQSWRRMIPIVPPGTAMYVVVRSYPCGPTRHNCGHQLMRFAAQVPQLVYVPTLPYLSAFVGLRAEREDSSAMAAA